MMRALRSERDDGFTLIELLVVILIIGILAAIAVPVFLNQRKKGYDSATKSDLRNAANFEEIYLSDYGSYGSFTSVQAAEGNLSVSSGVTVTLVKYAGVNGYCLSAVNAKSGNTFYYDSQGGGLQPIGTNGCPVTTAGTAGGQVSRQ